MFKLNWIRDKVSSMSDPPMGSWFDPGVVCPDGTVMWLWDGDDASSGRRGEPERSPQRYSTPYEDSGIEQVHYHYHRFGMGPWLFLGLQISLAIALLLVLSPHFQTPNQDATLDSLTMSQPDDLTGFLY